MVDDATAITNLLYRYAEVVDAADYVALGELFAHARVIQGAGPEASIDGPGLKAQFEEIVIRYEDGTPRTKHVTTNPIVEIDDDGVHATCRSYYVVHQQIGEGPLAPIIAGRYRDRFEKVDGTWRWSEREYVQPDLIGDLSRHLRIEVARS